MTLDGLKITEAKTEIMQHGGRATFFTSVRMCAQIERGNIIEKKTGLIHGDKLGAKWRQ